MGNELMFGALKRAVRLIRHRGLGYPFHVFWSWVLPHIQYNLLRRIPPPKLVKLCVIALPGAFVLGVGIVVYSNGGWLRGLTAAIIAFAISRAAHWLFRVGRNLRIQHVARSSQTAHLRKNAFVTWEDYPVDSEFRRAVDEIRYVQSESDLVLGEIDGDGRVRSQYGPLPYLVSVPSADFRARKRFPVSVVLRQGRVLIRKQFGDSTEAFIQEWFNLEKLSESAAVPSVFFADVENNVLYKSIILGRTIRDILVEAGADILSSSTASDQSLAGLKDTVRLHAVLARGTALLSACIEEDFFLRMEEQIETIHRNGVANLSLTYGNVMVDERRAPWFIDMESAKSFKSTSSAIFRWYRDQDREKYNSIYGRKILTESRARSELKRKTNDGEGWYAPIDFGGGLATRGFWSIESGTGRWEYLNRQVVGPLVRGRRILDLGSNNGIMPLMMLREGARAVVGLELARELVEKALTVKSIFEWRDMRCYDFDIRNVNMLDILEKDYGLFDVVTTFCSLYYLAPEEMAMIIRKAAHLAPVMVVQANDRTRQEADDNKQEKSSSLFLRGLLLGNGYHKVEVHAPSGFSRPILIATHGSP